MRRFWALISLQILRIVRMFCPVQARRDSSEYTVLCWISSYTILPSRWNNVDRFRKCKEPRTCRQHVTQKVLPLNLRVCNDTNDSAGIDLSSSILNHTFTAMAARLLRVNVLAPITGMKRLSNLFTSSNHIHQCNHPSTLGWTS